MTTEQPFFLVHEQPLVKQAPYLKTVLDLNIFCNWKYVSMICGYRNNRNNLYFESPSIMGVSCYPKLFDLEFEMQK